LSGAVFISHSESDRARIEPIVGALRRSGIRVWIAPDDVPPGADYSIASDEAIESCTAFVVFVSEAAGLSRHVRAETQMAFTLNKPIFPVRLDDAPPPKGLRFFLNVQHWTNAFGQIDDRALARLVSAILESVGKESGTASPPRPSPTPTPSQKPTPTRAQWVGIAVVAGLIGLIVAIIAMGSQRSPSMNMAAQNPSSPIATSNEVSAVDNMAGSSNSAVNSSANATNNMATVNNPPSQNQFVINDTSSTLVDSRYILDYASGQHHHIILASTCGFPTVFWVKWTENGVSQEAHWTVPANANPMAADRHSRAIHPDLGSPVIFKALSVDEERNRGSGSVWDFYRIAIRQDNPNYAGHYQLVACV
jgi:hypothetical protein